MTQQLNKIGNVYGIIEECVTTELLIAKFDTFTDQETFVTPTLIIGWENVLKHFPEQSIKKTEIKKNLYWTFGFKERESAHKKFVSDFILICYKEWFSNYKFREIYPFTMSFTDGKRFLTKLATADRFISSNNVVYVKAGDTIFYMIKDYIDLLGLKPKNINRLFKGIKKFDFDNLKPSFPNLIHVDVEHDKYFLVLV